MVAIHLGLHCTPTRQGKSVCAHTHCTASDNTNNDKNNTAQVVCLPTVPERDDDSSEQAQLSSSEPVISPGLC